MTSYEYDLNQDALERTAKKKLVVIVKVLNLPLVSYDKALWG